MPRKAMNRVLNIFRRRPSGRLYQNRISLFQRSPSLVAGCDLQGRASEALPFHLALRVRADRDAPPAPMHDKA